PVILVMGGSQGARKINEMILEALPFLLPEFELIHQCGEKNYKQVLTEAEVMINEDLSNYYHLFSFLREKELKSAYAIADIIVNRSGGNSIFEIAALGKPSILVPLKESAQNHQLKNAYTYAENGAALVIEESNLTPHFFLEKLKFLMERPNEMEKMRLAAKEFSKPKAAKIIAQYLLDYLL
ncbi:glycosyltransferase, partial [Patescibacteria group bacterium]